MGIFTDALSIVVETPSGRSWVCAPIDRATAFRVGLLQAALGIARDEAARVGQLLHLDAATREAILAESDAAEQSQGRRDLAAAIGQRDELAVACVRALRLPDGREAPVRLVLAQADADPDASPERVWVGSLPLPDLLAIGSALLAPWVAEVRDGATFRPSPAGGAGPG